MGKPTKPIAVVGVSETAYLGRMLLSIHRTSTEALAWCALDAGSDGGAWWSRKGFKFVIHGRRQRELRRR